MKNYVVARSAGPGAGGTMIKTSAQIVVDDHHVIGLGVHSKIWCRRIHGWAPTVASGGSGSA